MRTDWANDYAPKSKTVIKLLYHNIIDELDDSVTPPPYYLRESVHDVARHRDEQDKLMYPIIAKYEYLLTDIGFRKFCRDYRGAEKWWYKLKVSW